MSDWLQIRGVDQGPLFRDVLGRPILASRVSAILKKALSQAGLDPTSFGTHSFRIGRCSDLAKGGASEAQIRFLGRFHSDAFLKYVRPQVFG